MILEPEKRESLVLLPGVRNQFGNIPFSRLIVSLINQCRVVFYVGSQRRDEDEDNV